MQQYTKLVLDILEKGVRKKDRTETGTLSLFGQHYEVDLAKGFPLLTTKKMHFRSIILEMLWYLRGEPNIRWLKENNCHIWDNWAEPDGEVGPIYPVLWRNFPPAGQILEPTNPKWYNFRYIDGIDQIQNVINLIKNDPYNRRMVVSAWHPGLLEDQSLPPCHLLFVFNVADGKLNCHLTQRSGDVALGIPFNMACYSAFTMGLASYCGLQYGKFSHTIVDAHIYSNHIDGLEKQIVRQYYDPPQLIVPNTHPDEWTLDDFKLQNYQHHPGIKFEVAI